jgi:hypothetical protein
MSAKDFDMESLTSTISKMSLDKPAGGAGHETSDDEGSVSSSKSLSSYTNKELIAYCKANGIKGYSGKKKEEILALIDSKPAETKEPVVEEDTYTEEILKARFNQHKTYVEETIKIRDSIGLSIRLPVIPEDITENMVKHILHNLSGEFQDKTSMWTKSFKSKQKITGDLVSKKENVQECKCFSSDGPISFGPTENWDVIYFLDAREWLEDKFVLWRVPLSNTAPEWKSTVLNKSKNESFESQSAQGRRPRINWDALYPQIAKHATKVFDGSFTDIFTR